MDQFSARTEQDFNEARLRAFWNDVGAFLNRRPNELLSFDAVRSSLPIYGQSYRGVQAVPVAQIVGTTSNRYYDFDRAFLPSQVRTKSRWKKIDELRMRDVNLPPIQLYQVGSVYFVRDGHHRVSVARQIGQEYIDAQVIEMHTRTPLTTNLKRLDPTNLEALGEYASFLEKTQLDKLRPDVNLDFSQPGGYARLLEHIVVHQYFLGLDYRRDVSWQEAVTDWYDFVYLPIVSLIRERNILREFSGRTEADLYLWITDHHWSLNQQELEHHTYDVGFAEAAEDMVRKRSPRLSRKIARAIEQWVVAWRGANQPASNPDAGIPEPVLEIVSADLSKDAAADMITSRIFSDAPYSSEHRSVLKTSC
ncbi:MAG: transcriptional regulator [Chloroflexi bacterium]|nr:transcriptional regulator [Chloroflexota bacterium]